MQAERPPLFRAFCRPHDVASFTLGELSVLLAQARQASLGGRLAYKLLAAGIVDLLPAEAADRIEADRLAADHYRRIIGWEVECVQRVLCPVASRIVLLKGAAYFRADLPVGRGRIATDVDILVAESELGTVERTLLGNGWVHVKDREYDQEYYREYMHELPPFMHAERRMVVDVHHNILPRTSRLAVDATRLLARAVPIADSDLWRLSDEDMILHASAHLFHDGEIAGSFRELVDLDDLIRDSSGTAGFWPRLLRRSEELHLVRPLYYALRYSNRFLATPLSPEAEDWQAAVKPSRAVRVLMDRLVAEAFRPPSPFVSERKRSVAPFLLYLRSHWLRMPPLLLARHLTRKAWITALEKMRPRRPSTPAL